MRLLSPPVIGWVLYDFANTIFSFVVVTRYFNDWIIEEQGQPDIYVGLMVAAVSLALIVTLPLIGVLADRIGHKPILIVFTLVCIAATGLLGVVESVLLALVVGAIATYGFNTSDSQYHPLLGVVAPEHSRARVSGIGVAAGFIGILTTLALIGGIATDGHAQRAFLPAAGLFLLFALPMFFLVRERDRAPSERSPVGPFAQLSATVRRARGAPHGRLILARFFYVDALATVLQFMTVYARRTGDFDGGDINVLLALATVFGLAGAIGGGLLAERIGPRRVVLGTLVMSIGALVVGATHGLERAAVGARAGHRDRASARCRRSIASSCCGSSRTIAAARTSRSTRSSASCRRASARSCCGAARCSSPPSSAGCRSSTPAGWRSSSWPGAAFVGWAILRPLSDTPTAASRG